ncbi:unnamed protein product [Danaus chrysippus]|uniref:(African queen) hypothetical protein n=1 Tax=Danaus chrysippus TaxID=151541 RepID=A0A8J2R3J9_9NEOP|nr:unnamed protein product [Danaus chrysippus]
MWPSKKLGVGGQEGVEGLGGECSRAPTPAVRYRRYYRVHVSLCCAVLLRKEKQEKKEIFVLNRMVYGRRDAASRMQCEGFPRASRILLLNMFGTNARLPLFPYTVFGYCSGIEGGGRRREGEGGDLDI